MAHKINGSWTLEQHVTCDNKDLFVEFQTMDHPLEVALGDGHALRASGRRTVTMKMKLPNGRTCQCTLHNVLFVPKLAYNLLSVSRATKAGKLSPDGSVKWYKARLVAQGFSQKFGFDYEETFIPVVRFESVRVVIALAAQHGLKLHQMDVATAFLNGKLEEEEEVYMKQPEGFVATGQENLVCKLKRSIYGLKQSSRCWNHALDGQLKKMGFKQTASDPCLYVTSEEEIFIIAVYVDDILLSGKSDQMMVRIKETLAWRFEMKDLGMLHHFLGVKVVQNSSTGEIWIATSLHREIAA